MPIYEYHCDECQESFELLVRSIHAQVIAACPKCGSEHVRKQVSVASALSTSIWASASASASCAPSG